MTNQSKKIIKQTIKEFSWYKSNAYIKLKLGYSFYLTRRNKHECYFIMVANTGPHTEPGGWLVAS